MIGSVIGPVIGSVIKSVIGSVIGSVTFRGVIGINVSKCQQKFKKLSNIQAQEATTAWS